MSNGEQWKKQSNIINTAFSNRIPAETFVSLSLRLCAGFGDKAVVQWDNLAQRYALDAVGSTVLGHDFNAITTDSPFVSEYNGVMSAIANPLYLLFPAFERLFPRKKLITRIDQLVEKFMNILLDKRATPGDDMMSFMLQDPGMSDKELRDNMIVLFIGGHVCFKHLFPFVY